VIRGAARWRQAFENSREEGRMPEQIAAREYTAAFVACGDLGARLAARLPAARWRKVGLRRDVSRLPPGMEAISADLTRPDSLAVLGELKPDLLLLTPTPLSRDAAGYEAGFAQAARNLVGALDGHRPRWACMLSSTRVYAEAQGAWVDEDSALRSDEAQAAAIIDAERTFLEAIPGSRVLRSAGLYGGKAPGYLLRRITSGHLTPREPLRYSNRIHRDDVVGFLAWWLDRDRDLELHLDQEPRERIYNLVDDAPVAQQEVERWLCEQLSLDWQPPAEALEPPAHKRISNRRLRGTGYALQYPDYQSGYREILKRWLAHSEREDGLDFH
jgi:nucleoside-diphosphate-sugar epimerase